MPTDDDVVRFKNAFLGNLAQQQLPLLSHKVPIPAAARQSQRVLGVLVGLDDQLDQDVTSATQKREGTSILGRKHVSDKKSSSKKVADALAAQVDFDALNAISKGKGLAEAQTAITHIQDQEVQLQDAIADELLEQSLNAGNLDDAATRLEEALAFVNNPDVRATQGRDKVVLSMGGLLARALALGTVQDLLGATAQNLRDAFLQQIYIPQMIEKKAARPTGANGKIVNLARSIASIDAAALTPDSDAARVHAIITAANLGNAVALNSSRAPKYATGDVALQKFDNPQGGKVDVEGNPRFRDAVLAALGDLADTDSGKLLLTQFQAKNVKISPPSPANAQRVDALNGEVIYSNSGGPGKVALDPENQIAGEDASVEHLANEPWRQRDAAIALYHEMIHALIGNKGGEEWTAPDGHLLKISHEGEITELRIVGLDYRHTDKDGQTHLFPFSNPAYNPVTENVFRRDYARKKGEQTYFRRPSYANVSGQVKLSGGPEAV